MNGNFIISLDFELFWGVSETRTIASYRENLSNTREVVKKLLSLFLENNIEATWASVGFLFFSNKKELAAYTAKNKKTPNYKKRNLDNFEIISKINQKDNNFYFAKDLINKIYLTKGQEISTHTFSHFYSLEKGVTDQNFHQDLSSAIAIANDENIKIKSIVFPRNQYNDKIISICKIAGIKSYRGNSTHPIYKPSVDQGYSKRMLRLLDSYLNITGHHCFKLENKDELLNIPASRFLRPYNKRFFLLESLKINRILNSMTYAAKNNLNYHLWWHPHNFGTNIDENFKNLERIIIHQKKLKKKYEFRSINMKNLQKFTHKQ
tara:strand:+ start:16848 stop:17810 length:963 start_codon:yes stop_codon:yes gene_type:complete